MVPFETITLTVAAYLVIAVLLLSLNIYSLWQWWVKAGAIVVCGVFFIVSYFAITSLLGWPRSEQVPERFSLVATRIVEPNNITGDAGAIYLWLEHLNEDNITTGLPLSYQIAYSPDLAQTVNRAQEMLDEGERVEGSLEGADEQEADPAMSESTEQESTEQAGGAPAQSGGGGAGYEFEGTNLVFNDMPPVRLPGKSVL